MAGLNGGILRENNQIIGSGNIVPNFALCLGEIRISNKKLTKILIISKISSISKKIGVTVTDIEFKFLMNPAFTPKTNLKSFEETLQDNNIKPTYNDINSSGYYEVQFLQENWGGDILIFGPGPADQAHQEEEYVDMDTIGKTEKIFEDFVKKTCEG